MYKFNDGMVKFYKRLPDTTETYMPIPTPDPATERHFLFAWLGTKANEYYFARYAEVEIERRIQIPFSNYMVVTGDIAVIGAESFQVGRVWYGANKQGIKVTEITLEKLEGRHDDT